MTLKKRGRSEPCFHITAPLGLQVKKAGIPIDPAGLSLGLNQARVRRHDGAAATTIWCREKEHHESSQWINKMNQPLEDIDFHAVAC